MIGMSMTFAVVSIARCNRECSVAKRQVKLYKEKLSTTLVPGPACPSIYELNLFIVLFKVRGASLTLLLIALLAA